jgi:hypothetical protein
MKNIGIASSMGVGLGVLDGLLAGKAPNSIASKLGTATDIVQKFIDGEVTGAMATVLHTDLSAAQELRVLIGKQGAIGLLLGLCLNMPKKP